MSDGHTPRNSPSGEFYARVKDKYQLWIWAIGLFIASVPLVAYIGKLPTESQVKTAIAEAIAAHSSKIAHHGVSGMITRYAASKAELADLRGDVKANSSHFNLILRRLDQIDSNINELRGFRAVGKQRKQE